MWFLGIDTSNYTTSVALYNTDDNQVIMQKKLLPVRENVCGLRQSDAVFLHVKQLGDLVNKLMLDKNIKIQGIGVSAYPRNNEGSYMPCFLVGLMVADVLSAMLDVPKYEFSHQQGHIASALYSANRFDLFDKEFYAFHVSGGTTEGLKVKSCGYDMEIELIAKTLDLNAGQVIDRIGVSLGLQFPCGKELEKLALNCDEKIKGKATVKGIDCCLSGLENQCEKLKLQEKSKEYIAKFCLESIKITIAKMTENIIKQYGEKDIIYAGGVMSNSIIRKYLETRFNGNFASAEFSTDNSAGIAILASIKHMSK